MVQVLLDLVQEQQDKYYKQVDIFLQVQILVGGQYWWYL
jgi:hypothetical protein